MHDASDLAERNRAVCLGAIRNRGRAGRAAASRRRIRARAIFPLAPSPTSVASVRRKG